MCLFIYLFNAPMLSRFPKLVQQEVSFPQWDDPAWPKSGCHDLVLVNNVYECI
jgi:hypothetical protein